MIKLAPSILSADFARLLEDEERYDSYIQLLNEIRQSKQGKRRY